MADESIGEELALEAGLWYVESAERVLDGGLDGALEGVSGVREELSLEPLASPWTDGSSERLSPSGSTT